MTEVVADDTDVAVMLLHHWRTELHDILFTSDITRKSWSFIYSTHALPKGIKQVLPAIHAFSGCDTTSAIFGCGKATVLNKMKGI